MGHLRSHPCDHIGSSESEVWSESHGKLFPEQFRATELEFGGWARVLGIDTLKSICGSFRRKSQGMNLFLFSLIFTSTAYFSTCCLSVTLFLIRSLQNKCFQIVNQNASSSQVLGRSVWQMSLHCLICTYRNPGPYVVAQASLTVVIIHCHPSSPNPC